MKLPNRDSIKLELTYSLTKLGTLDHNKIKQQLRQLIESYELEISLLKDQIKLAELGHGEVLSEYEWEKRKNLYRRDNDGYPLSTELPDYTDLGGSIIGDPDDRT